MKDSIAMSESVFIFVYRNAKITLTNTHISNGTSPVDSSCIFISSGVFNFYSGSMSQCAPIQFFGQVYSSVSNIDFSFNQAKEGGTLSFLRVFFFPSFSLFYFILKHKLK